MIAMLESLTPREKISVAVAAVVVVLTVLVAGIILPYRSAMARLEQRIASRQAQLLEAQILVQKIRGMQGEVAVAERRLQATQSAQPLLPTIEGMVEEAAGKEKLLSVRPQPATPPAGFRQEKVEVQLEKIRLDQLLRLLHAIDGSSSALQTDTLKARPRFEDQGLLDVTMVVSSYAKASS